MNLKKLISALGIVLLPFTAWAGQREAISLDSRLTHDGSQQWYMCKAEEVASTASQISTLGFSTAAWAEASVPGTVLTNLVNQGKYPEPYFGQNNKLKNKLIPDLAHVGREFYTYWFRTEFDVPASFKGRRIWLEPEGINYRAEVWVNGNLVGVMAGMFNSLPIDITNRVKAGEKAALAVKVYPVDVPGTSMPKSWGAAGEWHNGGDGWIGQNVTQLMTVGWDFTYEDGIRDRNTGIWKSIKLYATGAMQLRHPMVRSALSHPDYDEAKETIEVEVFNPNNGGNECTLTARILDPDNEPIEVSKHVKLIRGEHKTVTFTPEEFPQLQIRNPRLWWPKNKGPQNLYTLEVVAVDKKGQLTDSISTRFGIREVTASRETPDKSKILVVNGKRMFVRGSNWIPEAMLRTDDTRMETELFYTDQSGINLLRLWGGGIAESDRFYELCDEYGIMVWQEFWMTGDTRHPVDETLYLANVENTVKRIRNHPSIVFYVSSNESTAVSGAEQLIERLDGTRPYQMQSEVDGIHDGSPYKQVNPMRHYENTASDRGSRVDGFNPEYGAPTLPIVQSLKTMMPQEDLWPINKETWDYMDGNGFHLMSTLYKDMVNEYGESDNIEEFARKGQMVGAMNSKSIWEVWNYNKREYGDRWCSGLLFWYHNCPNQQVCARMWDWNLEPTASLYHTMHALEPVHVQFDYLKNTVSVANDFLEAQKGLEVTAQIWDANSKLVSREKVSCDVPADGVANDVITLSFPETITPVHFIALEVKDAKGKTVSQNFYWRSTSEYEGKKTLTGPCTAGFQDLGKMPLAKPTVKAVRLKGEDGMNSWKISVRNKGKRIAFFCQLLLTNDKGEALHSTRYTDNFFTLLPGEEKSVVISTPHTQEKVYQLVFNENLGPEQTIRLP